jgi:hypothetical protein
VEPGRALFVSDDPSACHVASAHGLQLFDRRRGAIETLLP